MTQRLDRRKLAAPRRRPRSGALAALRLLEMCPLLPVDAFVDLVGLNSCSSAYQQLARLEHLGMADVQRVDLGYLLSERRQGLWRITNHGRLVLEASRGELEREAHTGGPGPFIRTLAAIGARQTCRSWSPPIACSHGWSWSGPPMASPPH
jgi:hypothetical protein